MKSMQINMVSILKKFARWNNYLQKKKRENIFLSSCLISERRWTLLKFVRFVDKINKILNIFLGVLLIIMLVVVFMQVFSRFILSLPLAWSEELSKYLMIYITFIAAAVAYRNQKLIAVEFIIENVNVTTRKVLFWIINIISMVFFVILFYQGILMIEKVSTQSTFSLGINMSIPYSAIPVGSFLLFINGLALIVEHTLSNKEVRD